MKRKIIPTIIMLAMLITFITIVTVEVGASERNNIINDASNPIYTTQSLNYFKKDLQSGWNTVSIPLKLQSSKNKLQEIIEIEKTDLIYAYDSYTKEWIELDASTTLHPMDAVFIKIKPEMNTQAKLYPYDGLSGGYTKQIKQGWNFIGVSLPIGSSLGYKMEVNRAIASLDDRYSSVISQALGNQRDWVYIKGDHSKPDVYAANGYWIYALEDRELAGLGSTPVEYIYQIPNLTATAVVTGPVMERYAVQITLSDLSEIENVENVIINGADYQWNIVNEQIIVIGIEQEPIEIKLQMNNGEIIDVIIEEPKDDDDGEQLTATAIVTGPVYGMYGVEITLSNPNKVQNVEKVIVNNKEYNPNIVNQKIVIVINEEPKEILLKMDNGDFIEVMIEQGEMELIAVGVITGPVFGVYGMVINLSDNKELENVENVIVNNKNYQPSIVDNQIVVIGILERPVDAKLKMKNGKLVDVIIVENNNFAMNDINYQSTIPNLPVALKGTIKDIQGNPIEQGILEIKVNGESVAQKEFNDGLFGTQLGQRSIISDTYFNNLQNVEFLVNGEEAILNNVVDWTKTSGELVNLDLTADFSTLNVISNLESKENVSYERPVKIKATANKQATWEITIKNPQGNIVATLEHTGTELDKTWSPSQYTINNGEYEVTIKAQAGSEQIENIETFNVYNYPVKNNEVNITIQGMQGTIKASIENLGPNAKSPMLIVQVKDENGYVVFIGTAQMEGLQAGQSINLSTGTSFTTGEYIAEVFVWDGWDSKNPLSEKNVSMPFVVDSLYGRVFTGSFSFDREVYSSPQSITLSIDVMKI